MAALRGKIAALGLVAAIVGLTGGAVFAEAVHPYCAAKEHACGRPATITTCCCGDQDTSWTDSAPVQSRVEVRADMTVTPALPAFVHPLRAAAVAVAIQNSPPRSSPLDLPTLFATLLI